MVHYRPQLQPLQLTLFIKLAITTTAKHGETNYPAAATTPAAAVAAISSSTASTSTTSSVAISSTTAATAIR